jgi:integrase
MGRKRNLTPTVDEHRGRVRARWTSASGRHELDLGAVGEPEVWRAALAQLTERLARDPDRPPRLPRDLLVSELLAAWLSGSDLAHASDLTRYRHAINQFLDRFPGREAASVTAGELQDWVVTLAQLRTPDKRPVYSESTITARLAYIKRAWRWAARQELVPSERSIQFDAVGGPQPGLARKPRKRRAADPAMIAKILPHLRPPVRAMVELQRLTGARPSELFRLRPCDVLRAGTVEIADYGRVDLAKLKVWLVVWAEHKTAGAVALDRWIVFGKAAQAILKPFLDREAQQPCFSPRESLADRCAEARVKRLAAGGGSGGSRKPTTGSRAAERYSKGGYRQAVLRACDRAGVERLTPYQIRHLFAIDTRDRHGLDHAQAAMGHTSAATTIRYAKRSFRLAVEVAKKSG